MNDVSMRDFQMRTAQWLQGKSWEGSTPLGPWLVTSDESPGPNREISCEVNGEQKQKADTADLVFDPAALVAYASIIHTLEPGDVIATGTPGGVGMPSGTFLDDGARHGHADRRPGGVPERLPSRKRVDTATTSPPAARSATG